MSQHLTTLQTSQALHDLRLLHVYEVAVNALRDVPLIKICLAVFACWLVSVIGRSLNKAYRSPLSDVPGPWVAKFTRLWLMRGIGSRSWDKINIRLHRQYGPVVRISPNEFSIDDPEAAKIIYRTRDELVKGKRYSGWAIPDVEPMVFADRDIERHTQRRKEVNGLYSNNVIYNMEKPLDMVVEALVQRFLDFAQTGEVIEVFDWLHYFAFDAIGVFTFGKTFGFLQTGSDIGSVMEIIHNYSRYGAVIGVFAEWHPILFKIMSALSPKGDVGMAYLIKFSSQAIAELGANRHEYKEGEKDILSSLLAKHYKDPSTFTMEDVHHHILPNVVGGAETTGISLSAALYFLWKNPRTLARLRHELITRRPGADSRSVLKIHDAANCSYLQAVIKETLRLHPGNGLGLTRIVPKGGLILAGRYFPEGTEVSMNAYVAHANPKIFGEDPEVFRPERWLQDSETVRQMENYFLTFGKGTRTCMGKNISLMEINKVVASLVMRFDFEFEHPEREWTVHNDWFVRQQDIKVRVRLRKTDMPSAAAS